MSASRSYELAPPLVIVPCGARKRADAALLPAGQLYTGSYHLACRRAATALTTPERTLILSGLHGLLPLDRAIAPYELRMGQPGSVTADQLRRQAEQLDLADERHVIVLAAPTSQWRCRCGWRRPLRGRRRRPRPPVGGPGRHRMPRQTGSGVLSAAAAACGPYSQPPPVC